MALTSEQSSAIVQEHGRGDKDTGSPEVQIALLTQRIRDLTEHSKVHPLDHSSRRGLLKLVGQRKRMMSYLRSGDPQRYQALIDDLGIRG